MRNPFEIASKLRLILVSNSSIRRSFNLHSQNYAICTEKSSKRRSKKKLWENANETIGTALSVISAKRSKKNRKGHTLYLLDEIAAKKFASMVVANREKNSSHVIEINSGLGLLTKELLDAGIQSIKMFEGLEDFWPGLVALSDKYPDRLKLEKVDFHHLWKVAFLDSMENSKKLDLYFEGVKRRSWNEEPAVEIIGMLENMRFIRRLISAITYQNSLSKYGRMVLYAAVPPSIWAHLNCTNEHYDLYRPYVIMFQTLFRCELLGQLPRSSFYPNHKKSIKSTKCRSKIRENDENIMYVVKIEAKTDIFMDKSNVPDILPFHYFVTQNLHARTKRIIPTLENWIPGCGRTLIAQGYNIFTEFGELTPDELLKLFKEFQSWPGYKKSTFISSMETILGGIDENIVFETNSENIDDIFESSMNEHQDNQENLEM